jgi:hypothetical protein
MTAVVQSLNPQLQAYWTEQLVGQQRSVMIAAAATAVGINMTFLLPYSMLARGWDKPFRGLARFDLATGMAIPYVLVTSCVVIASAYSLHNSIDESMISDNPATMAESPYYNGVEPILMDRLKYEVGDEAFAAMPEPQRRERIAAFSEEEKRVALSLVKRDAFQLSSTLEPLLGTALSNLVFGLGVFGMGFSTIVILMLINGYAFREMFNSPNGTAPFVIGCLVAGSSGAMWWYLWGGEAKFWLAIFASNFGMMLLPIAYITFFLMMNSKRILGDQKPTGVRMLVWNILMLLAVAGAAVAAISAIWNSANNPKAFPVIIALLAVYAVALLGGFFLKRQPAAAN